MKSIKESKRTIFNVLFVLFSLLIFALSVLFRNKMNQNPWDGTQFDLSKVNWLDRTLAHPFSHSLHKLGTLTCLLDLALVPFVFMPLLALKSEHKIKNYFFLSLTYAETVSLTKGGYDLLKVSVCRIRPFMYFANPYEKAVLSGDWQYSWPSGHTSNVFLCAAIILCITLILKDKSKLAKACVITGYAIAVITACLRVLSGNHFPTDVLSGAVFGSMTGFFVPWINYVFGNYTDLIQETSLSVNEK